ncbi:MAG: aminotransferase class V-fold PLP-dependent enzyme [Pseudomonadota bacterium]
MQNQTKSLTDIPGLLQEVRGRFAHVDDCPLTGERIFFENAGGALTLNSVVETSAKFAAIPDNQGRANEASKQLGSIIAKAKEDIFVFFNASDGSAFVGESGTELLFRLVSAAALATEADGIILGSTLEHPATRSACHRWAEVSGKEHVLAKHNKETGTVTVEDYEGHITEKVRVATIVHTSPVTGMAVDVAAISKAIRNKSPDCLIIVDGIQHASHGGIDVAACGIDGYVISPYKVFSRHGYGVAWVSDRLMTMPHDRLVGGPEANWELGTRDTGSYATFSDVVDYFDWLGSHFTESAERRTRIEEAGKAIHVHEKNLVEAMLFGTGNVKGLTELEGINIIGGIDNPLREGLVSLYVEHLESATVVSELDKAGIRVHIRKADHYSGNILEPLGLKDCVRVSLCHYNSEQEVAKFLTAMAELVGTNAR